LLFPSVSIYFTPLSLFWLCNITFFLVFLPTFCTVYWSASPPTGDKVHIRPLGPRFWEITLPARGGIYGTALRRYRTAPPTFTLRCILSLYRKYPIRIKMGWKEKLECPVDSDGGYVNDRWTNRDLIPIPAERRTYKVWSFAVSPWRMTETNDLLHRSIGSCREHVSVHTPRDPRY
jgi:hypothetical protein